MTVTSAVLVLSLHRLSSSPLFRSQQKTSSFAPTIALPTPVGLLAVVGMLSSSVQVILDVPEVMSPKDLECSYFLELLAFTQINRKVLNALTSKILPYSGIVVQVVLSIRVLQHLFNSHSCDAPTLTCGVEASSALNIPQFCLCVPCIS